MNQRLEGRPSTSGNVDRQTLARTYQNLRDDRMPSRRPTGSLFDSFLSSCLTEGCHGRSLVTRRSVIRSTHACYEE
jgi:hypothetical protein